MTANVETMAYANEVPWHGIGTPVSSELTTDEMLKSAQLDWLVQKKPAMVDMGKETPAVSDEWFMLVRDRDNKILGPCGKKYVPIQNKEIFDFLRKFVEAGHMDLETAGSLDGGRHVWALAKLNKGFKVVKGDEIEGYLLISLPHIWGKAGVIQFSPIRVVCMNTLVMALQSKTSGRFRFPHLQSFSAVEYAAEEALGISLELLNQFKEQSQYLSKKKYTEHKLEQYIAELFQKDVAKAKQGDIRPQFKRTAMDAYDCVHRQPTVKSVEGTWWNALNGVTYYTDHVAGADRSKALESAFFGQRAALKRRALDLAVEMAK